MSKEDRAAAGLIGQVLRDGEEWRADLATPLECAAL
jgi:hypothetical protein